MQIEKNGLYYWNLGKRVKVYYREGKVLRVSAGIFPSLGPSTRHDSCALARPLATILCNETQAKFAWLCFYVRFRAKRCFLGSHMLASVASGLYCLGVVVWWLGSRACYTCRHMSGVLLVLVGWILALASTSIHASIFSVSWYFYNLRFRSVSCVGYLLWWQSSVPNVYFRLSLPFVGWREVNHKVISTSHSAHI
jgi:hypothetical protein